MSSSAEAHDAVSHASNPPKRVVVLGSSGSIGKQTIDVARRHDDKVRIVGLAVNKSIDTLADQARLLDVRNLALADESLVDDQRYGDLDLWVRSGGGASGLGSGAVLDLIRLPEADVVVNALVGAAGLRASYVALAAGKVLALANKESLVVGGDLIMPLAKRLDDERGCAGSLMPIDSEHGAIYQCLIGESHDEVARLWVTASGGPFRGCTRDDLESVTPEQALAHPTWNMGAKISIDSSTLMNKGLEVIEAHHLFAMPYEKIEVVVQPQSVVHSMVEYIDGSVKAHLGTTDMRIPIQFALSFPDRWEAPVAPVDFRTLGTLEFEPPDPDTFRCLALAREAGMTGGTLPAAMNAANEVAVAAFLDGEIGFLDIAACVEEVMTAHEVHTVESLEQLEAVDTRARRVARQWIDAS